jgi:manganese transport protein
VLVVVTRGTPVVGGRQRFGISFALVPLILLTRRADLMGELVNRRSTTVAAAVCAALVIVLNGFLVAHTLG